MDMKVDNAHVASESKPGQAANRGRLRHIALSVPDPWEAAIFYMDAFGMEKIGETDSVLARGVYLTDGVINLALLNYKTDEAAGGDRPASFTGIHHIGFWVDDANATGDAVKEAGGKWLMGEVADGNTFYEVKYRDTNNIIFDVSGNGWGGAVKDPIAAPDQKGPELRDPKLVAKR